MKIVILVVLFVFKNVNAFVIAEYALVMQEVDQEDVLHLVQTVNLV